VVGLSLHDRVGRRQQRNREDMETGLGARSRWPGVPRGGTSRKRATSPAKWEGTVG
jgi:hypothetical protein